MKFQQGNLNYQQAKQLNESLKWLDNLRTSVGTGDQDFTVGQFGLATNVEMPQFAIVQVTDASISYGGKFPATIVLYDEIADAVTDLEIDIWLRNFPDNDLVEGYYLAMQAGYDEARTVYHTTAGAAGTCLRVVHDVTCVNGLITLTYQYVTLPLGASVSDTSC